MKSLVFLIAFPDIVISYYCDHNLCHAADEYCCGDNLCCDYANSSSYFWLSILLVLLILALVWALLGLFCLEILHQKQEAIKVFVGKVVNFASSRRNGSAWIEDPESSLLSRNELMRETGGKKSDGTPADVYYHHHRHDSDGGPFVNKK